MTFPESIPKKPKLRAVLFRSITSELGNVFITGYAGSGSVMFLHRIIISLLQLKQSYKNDMKFVLADKELNEFSLYKNLDCVQQPIIADYLAFISALKNADAELDARLQNPNQTHSDYVLIVNRFDYFYEEWRLRNESVKNSYSISQKILEPICKLVRKRSAVNMYVILFSPIPDSTIFSNQLKSVMGNRIVFLSESKFYDERAIKDTFGVNVDTSYTTVLCRNRKGG